MTATVAEPTTARLLDAAETLIGERGVDAVSLRAINAAAHSNVAAVHYHFGTKEALVHAALERRMTVLGEARLAPLEALEADPAPTARAAVAVLVRPLATFAREAAGGRYVRFLAALDRAGGAWIAAVDAAFAPQYARLGPLLARATPDLDTERRARRLALGGETMLRMLADPYRYARGLDDDGYTDEVIDVVTAILTAPTRAQEAR